MPLPPLPISQIAASRGLRVFKDPCWTKSWGDWGLEIRGLRGSLYAHGADSFWIELKGTRFSDWKALEPLEERPGDGEARFLFPATALDAALELLQPRKKRRLSDEEKARLREMGFKPGSPRKTTPR